LPNHLELNEIGVGTSAAVVNDPVECSRGTDLRELEGTSRKEEISRPILPSYAGFIDVSDEAMKKCR